MVTFVFVLYSQDQRHFPIKVNLPFLQVRLLQNLSYYSFLSLEPDTRALLTWKGFLI